MYVFCDLSVLTHETNYETLTWLLENCIAKSQFSKFDTSFAQLNKHNKYLIYYVTIKQIKLNYVQ